MARTLMSMPPTSRVGRYPRHTFLTRELPFTAQPFFLARVLPGETMKNMKFEARVITDPILNSIIGWKKEYFFFYVKVTDLMNDAIKDMFVDPTNAEIAGLDSANNVPRTYCAKGGIDWVSLCLDRVVTEYFRDDGETAAQFVTAAGDRIVQIRQNSFLDSLTDKDALPEGDAIASATDAGDLERLMTAFEMARSLGLADMNYEDFLRSYGIPIPKKDENKPELLGHFSEFQYPSNTIDPLTGAPSSACSWVFNTGQRDPKMFKEPGFVIGVSVTRPKVYLSGLAGLNAGFAQRAWDWVPNYLRDHPEVAIKSFAAGTGPLGDRTTDTDGYYLDMRDELLYGDQFQNVVPFAAVPASTGAHHMLALPATDFNWKYPTEAMLKSFFVDSVNSTFIRQDGYVSLHIQGSTSASVVDYTVGNLATA
nr:major capsid protein [Rattus norvegicus microvirus]